MQSVQVTSDTPQVTPPEQRYDGASVRGLDVITAIRAAHNAGAWASSVTTDAVDDERRPARLTAHLYLPHSFTQRAPLSVASAVLAALDADLSTTSIDVVKVDGAHATRVSARTEDGLVIVLWTAVSVEEAVA
jgi:hypothetical protein